MQRRVVVGLIQIPDDSFHSTIIEIVERACHGAQFVGTREPFVQGGGLRDREVMGHMELGFADVVGVEAVADGEGVALGCLQVGLDHLLDELIEGGAGDPAELALGLARSPRSVSTSVGRK